jgi:DNA-binding GntR family transcriptional regulator
VPPRATPHAEPDAVLVSQDVLTRLKGDILDGAFAPGARLRFAELQRLYGAGIGTLREALSHLLPEGLVELDANRGFRVAVISAEDLRDVSALHVEFEQRSIVESVRSGDDAWEAGLVLAFHRLAKIERLSRDERKARSSEWLVAHRDFHRALVAACRRAGRGPLAAQPARRPPAPAFGTQARRSKAASATPWWTPTGAA